MPLDEPDEDDLVAPEADDREMARMPLTDHIEELRHRLILALIGPVVAMVITLAFGRSLIYWVTRPLFEVQALLGLATKTYAFGPASGFGVYLKVSLVAAIIIAFPWICYQLWKFVESGLYAHERKGIVVVFPFSAVMSALGVLFLYYLLLPACLAFLLFFNSTFPAVDTHQQSRDGGFLDTFVNLVVSSYGMERSDDDGDGGDTSGSDARDESEAGKTNDATTQPATAPLIPQLPRLARDPTDPRNGQVWIKVPEGELRYYLNGEVRRSMPFKGGSMLGTMMDIHQYLSFVAMLALGVIIGFQLPVVLLILGWSGLVSPHWLSKYRKYCVFACFAIGAVFTPADPVSMMVLALPLWGLFELGLVLMRLTYRAPEPMD